MPLPTIRIKDIGKDGKGATPEEIASQIMDAVLKGAQNAVASAKINVDQLTGGHEAGRGSRRRRHQGA
ncbi:MAG: hypothetical protein HOG93_08640 [Rhodospirillaceae bacterium]|nr:hypothetical protein [Rhodospirillaceae bacterium]